MTPDYPATVLGPLPKDWRVLPLGAVLRRTSAPINISPEVLYREIGIRSHGKGLFHKQPVTGESLGRKRVFVVEPGCLVFNIVFAWEGAVAVTGGQEVGMIASHRFPMYRPNSANLVNVDFLFRYFQTKLGVRLLGEASPGGAGRNRTLSQRSADEIPVPVPPLPEQQKIAAILSSIDGTVERSVAIVNQLSLIRALIARDLFSPGHSGKSGRAKDTVLGALPEHWSVEPVRDLIADSSYGTSTKCHTDGSGFPVLRIPNVVSGEIRTDDLKYTAMPESEVERYQLIEGDILIVRTNGNPKYVGRTAVFTHLPGVWLFASYLIRLRVKADRVLPEFLAEALRSPGTRRLLEAGIRTSAGNYNLNSEGIRSALVPVPPLDEQARIVRVLAGVDSRLIAEKGALSHLTDIRSALSQSLLSGDVRVPPREAAA